jgi:hypothetical protein
MEFGSLAAQFEERRGEKREEDAGLYRQGIEGHLLAQNQRGVTPTVVSIDREGGRGIRGEDGAECGAHISVSEEGIGWGTDLVFFLGCGLLA